MHKRRLTPGLLTAIGLFLAASPAWAARVKSDADKGPEKPPLPAIVSLELQPKSLTLTDGRDARQVLVWAIAEDGRRFDVTDLATFSAQSPMLQVGTDHYVHATAAGDGTVLITAVGKETTLSVSVSNAALAPVRFVRDIEPVLAAVGCNAGTCHGAAKGKNGFKLSLRGYDPEFDFEALLYDLSGRRFNRAEPGRSLMLAKPTQQVPHGGGMRFDKDSDYYKTVHKWIAQGVPFG